MNDEQQSPADDIIANVFDRRSAKLPDPRRRLEGDDLYTWALLVADVEHAQRALNTFGKNALQRLGVPLQHYALTNDGYIVRGDEHGPVSSEPSPAESLPERRSQSTGR